MEPPLTNEINIRAGFCFRLAARLNGVSENKSK
jgi:hypothetical protein